MRSVKLVAIAVALLVLAATHWKAFVAGEKSVRAEYQAQALKASEAARQREQQLVSNVEELRREIDKQKERNAAAARAHAERLREYQGALGRAAAQAAAAPGRVDEPFARIAGECGAALVAMDAHARELARIARGLQGYTAEVCLKPNE